MYFFHLDVEKDGKESADFLALLFQKKKNTNPTRRNATQYFQQNPEYKAHLLSSRVFTEFVTHLFQFVSNCCYFSFLSFLFVISFFGIPGFLHRIFDWAPLNLIKFPRPNGHGLLQPISPRPSGWICQRRTNPKPGTASIVLGNIASQALTRIRGLLAPVRLVHLSALLALIDWPYRSKRQHSPIHDEYLPVLRVSLSVHVEANLIDSSFCCLTA